MIDNKSHQPLQKNAEPQVGNEKSMILSVQEAKEIFFRGCLLIFYHPAAHSEEFKCYTAQLQTICNLKVFTEWEEASIFIGNNYDKCHIITSETNGEKLVREISEQSNVFSISVWCSGRSRPYWTEDYEQKIILVETNFQTIIDKIRTKIINLQPNSPSLTSASKQLPLESEIYDKDKKEFFDAYLTEEGHMMTSIEELRIAFLKDCLLILCASASDLEAMKECTRQLQSICKLKVFTDYEEAADFIENCHIDCCVITSEVNAESFVKKIFKKDNVFSINVYCTDIQLAPQWIKTYRKKITGVKNDCQIIVDQMKTKILSWQAKSSSLRVGLPTFSPIFTDYEKSENDHLNIFLTGNAKFANREQSKRDFLNLARVIYQDTENMNEFEKDYNEYNLDSILRWYSKESFLYKLLNNSLRIALLDTIYYSRFVLKDLERAIKEQYQQKSRHFNGLLYRGAYMSDADWTRLQQNQGKDIEMHGFLSTTQNKNVAEAFAQDAAEKKALVTIIVPPSLDEKGQGFAEMRDFSLFSDEDEVLFNIRSRFTILETNSEDISGVAYRHLVLLYGAQSIRQFIHFNNPTIEMDFKNLGSLKCVRCHLHNQLSQEMMFINIENIQEQICYSCIKKSQDLKMTALAGIKHGSNLNLKIDGKIMRYNQKPLIPFYGYKCQSCQSEKLKRRIICQQCREIKKEWCDSCFDMENNECIKAAHIIIIENEPYSFWSEKMKENEIIQIQMQEKQIYHQGEMFEKALVYSKAKQFYERKLALHESLDGQTLVLYSKLGMITTHLGELEKGMEYYSKALEMAKAVYGDEHHITAACYYYIGSVNEKLGELDKAMKNHSKALEIRKAVYGDKHPNTANSYNNVGLMHKQLGELKKAMENYSNALEIRKAVFGDKHPSTAICYNNLGSVHEQLGELEKAMKYYLNTLEIRKAVYGDRHPSTVISYKSLGSVHQELGELEKAMKYYSTALQITKAMHGDQHPNTATCYNNLGLIHEQLGELKKAREHYSNALEITKAMHGDKHPSLAICYNNIGSMHRQLGELEKAIEYLSNALEITKAVYGDKHSNTAACYNNLGFVYKQLGDFEKAVKHYLSSLEIKKAVYGDKHSSIATSYNNLGAIHQELGELEKAIEYLSNALEITKAVYGDKHSNIVTCYNNLGATYQDLGELDKAIEYLSNALEITKAVYGEKHPSTATSYNNLGSVHQDLGELDKAMKYYSNALEIRKAVYGDNHPSTATCYNNLGAVHQDLGELEKAMRYYSNALEINKAVYGDKHPLTTTCYNNLGSVQEQFGELKKGREDYSNK